MEPANNELNDSAKAKSELSLKTPKSAKPPHSKFKRNVIAIAVTAVIWACGSAAILSSELSSAFDEKTAELCKKLSHRGISASYKVEKTGWLFFKKEAKISISGKRQDGQNYTSELNLNAYIMPWMLNAEIDVPPSGHPVCVLLKELGINKLYLNADWSAATLLFESDLPRALVKKVPQLAGALQTQSVMGMMTLDYKNGTNIPPALTLGTPKIVYFPDFLPGANAEFENAAFTLPLVNVLETEHFSTPVFSILEVGKLTVKLGEQRYQLNTLELERSLVKGGKRELDKLSFYLGADHSLGQVKLAGDNASLNERPGVNGMHGSYLLKLTGNYFSSLDNPLFAELQNKGFLKAQDDAYLSRIEINKRQLKLNGQHFDIGSFLGRILGKLHNVPASVPSVPAPMVEISK